MKGHLATWPVGSCLPDGQGGLESTGGGSQPPRPQPAPPRPQNSQGSLFQWMVGRLAVSLSCDLGQLRLPSYLLSGLTALAQPCSCPCPLLVCTAQAMTHSVLLHTPEMAPPLPISWRGHWLCRATASSGPAVLPLALAWMWRSLFTPKSQRPGVLWRISYLPQKTVLIGEINEEAVPSETQTS